MIKIMSRGEMCRLLEGNPTLPEKGAKIISINEYGGEKSPTEYWYPDGHPNILKLNFSDVEYKISFCHVPMSAQDGQRVYEFLKEKTDLLYVHCFAGVSRSGAVGTFANEMWGEDEDKFKARHPHIDPNQHILTVLRSIRDDGGLKDKYPRGSFCPCAKTRGRKSDVGNAHCIHCGVDFE